MNCPKCLSDKIKVNDTRSNGSNQTRRRKQCTGCGYRFSTIEFVAEIEENATDLLKQLGELRVKLDELGKRVTQLEMKEKLKDAIKRAKKLSEV